MRLWGFLVVTVVACVAGNEVVPKTSDTTQAGFSCGNSIIETGEECDDGNGDNTDACVFCQDAECGDGNEWAGMEDCDLGSGNSNAPDSPCRVDCTDQRCGDGIADPQAGEDCDDGNTANTDFCLNTCFFNSCGDGFELVGEEQCDDGNQINTDACIVDPGNKGPMCVDAVCGDGFVQAGVELCDDGNQDNTDTCTTLCAPPTCGDGFVQGIEECDDGNQTDTDFCRNNCMNAICGDGVEAFFEQCDDGNQNNMDACIIDPQAEQFCVTNSCGDGYVYTGVEECDDGNQDSSDACIIEFVGKGEAECHAARCGDGYIRDGVEQCDDQNDDTTDNCPSGPTGTCQFASCGDGFVRAGIEACDDGNQSNMDGCINLPQQKIFCQANVCGDGFLNVGVEQCDDTNTTSNDGCSMTCVNEVCGDGVVNGTEACDGGGESAECNTNCTPAECGDGIVNTAANEVCDEGASNSDVSPDTCRSTCQPATCGDEVVDDGEECDLGAQNGTNDFDGCSSSCGIITIAARSGACDAGGGTGLLGILGVLLLLVLRRRRTASIAALAAVTLLPLGAARADGFRLGRFAPAPSLDDGLALELPATLTHLHYSAQIAFDYSDRPFVLKTLSGGNERERDIIDDQLATNLVFAIGIGERFQLQARLPITLDQATQSGSINMQSFGADQTALGDFRVGGAVRLFGDRNEIGPSIGASADIVLPSGDEQDFAGDGGLGMDLGVLASYKLPLVTFGVNAGVALRPSADFADVRMGSELYGRAGALIPVGEQMNTYAELQTGVPLRDQMGEPPLPVEALGGLRYRFGNWIAGAGVGVGLSDALGVPVWRGMVSVGYTNQRDKFEEPLPEPPPIETKDKDADGILDDSCEMQPEDKDGFEDADGCPDDDNDKDLVLDASDKCIDGAEDKDGFQDEDGCAEDDNDNDKIVDANDKCANEPETVNTFEDEDGCPDSIPRPTLDMILKQLAERIQFEYDRAELTPDSQRVIGEMATLLNQVPELELLSIEGHASKEGNAKHNEELSKNRAQTAFDALVAGGVAASRLKAQHFGTKKPIGSAKDEASKKASRRVEFHVLRYAGQDVNVTPTAPPAAPTP